jgi:hypothetical protein
VALTDQAYANHRHRPVLFAAGMLFWLAGTILIWISWFGRNTLHLGLMLLLAAVWCALVMGRVYITRLQNRIIRLEMRLRCAALLAPARIADLDRLSIKQIVALRFASDAEIPGLLARTVAEHLTPDQIKKAVVNWVPDYERT